MYWKYAFVARILAVMGIVVLVPADVLLGKPRVSPAYQKVMKVVKSTELSKDEKFARLKEFTGAEETRSIALYQMEMLDPAKAMQIAAGVFRAKGSSRLTKLGMGHFMLTGERPRKNGFPKGFVKEFAGYLVGEILNGGQKEFCRTLPDRQMTAVGEYAYLASHFDGYKGVDFTPFKDARLVPILIKCLDAPDNIYSANEQSCCAHGKPGESTGRNTARQQIPVALAMLGDARGIKPLRRVLDGHHDWYERNNAAYALGMLKLAGGHTKLAAKMRARKVTKANGQLDGAKDRYYHLYAFGRGLLARGDDAGIEFMAFKYSIYDSYDDLSSNTYMLSERLGVLKGVKSLKLAGFFKQAFGDEQVMGVLLMDKTKVKPNDYGHTIYDFAKAAPRIEKMFDGMCQIIEANRLTSLRATIQQIARKSASKALRRRGEQCAAKLKKDGGLTGGVSL
jgi:hypothetical protein